METHRPAPWNALEFAHRARKLKPFRTLPFGVGALCLVGVCVQILMRAFA